MKKLCLLLLLLPTFAFSQSSTYSIGYSKSYIVTSDAPNDTLFGDEITISNNGFFSVKLLKGKKKFKYEKMDLLDFGVFHKKDGKRMSKYAEFAFFEPTFKGFFLYGVDQDTITAYIGKNNISSAFTKIKCYYRSPETMSIHKEFNLNEVKSFMIVDENEKESWYDAINMELGMQEIEGLDETILVRSYIENYAIRLAKGEVNLNQTEAIIRNARTEVYILTKDYKTTIISINTGLLNINAKEKLSELMSNAPHLVKKLNEKGYEYEHIPMLIEEYNAFKVNL